MSRYKGRNAAPRLRPGDIPHDGSTCPVPIDSKPGIVMRIGTRVAPGQRWADEWSAMEGGDCWRWQGKRPQPIDIVAYEPESEFVDIPFGGVAR